MPAQTGPLLDQLRRDADAAVAAQAAMARTEAERIQTASARERERRRAAATAERERALGLDAEVARVAETQRTAGATLEARAAFLVRVFAEAERQLSALATSPELASRLAPIVAEAAPFVAVGEVRARGPKAALPAVQAALASAGLSSVTIVADETVPLGAILERPDGAVRVDATFVARLRHLAASLSIEAVRAAESAEHREAAQ